ncbi:phage tail protein [Rivularia sp. PCC 7116]|uniref:phage tail protein n=1 Tax=Rivularia sp. PCC 7116 TaxID=373994 RepID=UPI00029EF8A0|nr:phage tail protein [Rivularia sp. PCC 7116]AFY54240.1 phage tail protein [Rivularia sp. PCC 7116]
MTKNQSKLVSSYQQYLPTVLQEDDFLGQFLLAFEKILSGTSKTSSQEQIITKETQNPPGLEEIIDNIHLYFNPQQTPEDFLPWLANWVALSLRNDWKVEVKREFIQQIVGLYRLRGTKAGLIKILSIYLKSSGFGEKVEVFDQFKNFPYYFQVQLTLNDRDPEKYWRQAKIAKSIIDIAKPAQTFYSLKILVPTMQLTKPSQVIFPFKLFESLQNQIFFIEVKINFPENNVIPVSQLANQLIIQLQGNLQEIIPDSSEKIIDNQSFSVKYKLNSQHIIENLSDLNVKLSNRTDKTFIGDLAIKFYFYINQIEFSNTVLEQPINLSTVLKICRLNGAKEVIEGNTIIQLQGNLQESGMRITEYIWTQPYQFQTFAVPPQQELHSDLTAIIDKIELEAIVKVNQPQAVTQDLLNKIIVRFKDDMSEVHLFTQEATIENNQITIKRTIYNQRIIQSIDKLSVNIKNINNIDIVGQIIVQATLEINQRLSSYKLLEENFNIPATSPFNILEICRRNEAGEIIIGETIPTILGTTSQSLN